MLPSENQKEKGKVGMIDANNFTHYARFYGVPCYANINDEVGLELVGRNLVFDWALRVMTVLHNEVVERGAQFFAAVFGQDYEPGFPVWVQEKQ